MAPNGTTTVHNTSPAGLRRVTRTMSARRPPTVRPRGGAGIWTYSSSYTNGRADDVLTRCPRHARYSRFIKQSERFTVIGRCRCVVEIAGDGVIGRSFE